MDLREASWIILLTRRGIPRGWRQYDFHPGRDRGHRELKELHDLGNVNGEG